MEKNKNPKPSPVIKKAADFKSIYANFAQVHYTGFDMSLTFGDGSYTPDSQNTLIELHTRVVMTIIEAKLVHQMLTEQIRVYEKKYGTVEIPEDLKLDIKTESK